MTGLRQFCARFQTLGRLMGERGFWGLGFRVSTQVSHTNPKTEQRVMSYNTGLGSCLHPYLLSKSTPTPDRESYLGSGFRALLAP